MVNIPLKALWQDKDRHGNVRYYVARRTDEGVTKIRIRGEFGTPEFIRNYENAFNGLGMQKASPLMPSTSFEWLCRQYMSSYQFNSEIGEGWRNTQRRILKNLCDKIGKMPYAKLERKHILAWIDARASAGKPGAASNLTKTLRSLFKFAIDRSYVPASPVDGVKKVKYKSKGFHSWTAEEVVQFEAKHPIGSTPRLAMALLLYTGLRKSDVVVLGKQHLSQGVIQIRNKKTGTEVNLPILEPLRKALEATPTGQLTFLITSFNKPYTSNGFGNAMREWCDQAGLPHCTAHGLRKAGATIAAENGATTKELMAIFGWESAEMAELYTRKAERKKLANDAMEKLIPVQNRNKSAPTDLKLVHPLSKKAR